MGVRQKVMVATIDQLLAECRAKDAGKGGQVRPGLDELGILRKELSDMRCHVNQLKQDNIQLKRECMEGSGGKFQGRGGYQGNGVLNYNQGGGGRENRGPMYKPRGGYKANGQPQALAPTEEKRETGFYMRSTGMDESPDR